MGACFRAEYFDGANKKLKGLGERLTNQTVSGCPDEYPCRWEHSVGISPDHGLGSTVILSGDKAAGKAQAYPQEIPWPTARTSVPKPALAGKGRKERAGGRTS